MTEKIEKPCLYVIGTPIGNLNETSERTKYILTEVDLIAAEDTRNTRKLLNALGIGQKNLISYFDAKEKDLAPELIARLKNEQISLGLVSDAGTPCISDPGYHLVRLAHKAGIKVNPVSGPSAITTLLSASGLPPSPFAFMGFLPHSENKAKKAIEDWRQLTIPTIIFFESAGRLTRSLGLIKNVFPQAEICLGRELTKFYEEIITTDIESLSQLLKKRENLKGEITLILHKNQLFPQLSTTNAEPPLPSLDYLCQIQEELEQNVPSAKIRANLQLLGLSRNAAYTLIEQLKKK